MKQTIEILIKNPIPPRYLFDELFNNSTVKRLIQQQLTENKHD